MSTECEVPKLLYRATCVNYCPDGSYELKDLKSAAGQALKKEPVLSYGRKRSPALTPRGMSCAMCHFTCRNCVGQGMQECTKCWEDGVLDSQVFSKLKIAFSFISILLFIRLKKIYWTICFSFIEFPWALS